MNRDTNRGTKAPQIENLGKITPEQAGEYIRYVAKMRHHQRRWFVFHVAEDLNIAKNMEKQLDNLNAFLLAPTPTLFG